MYMYLIDSFKRFAERLLLVESQGLCCSLFESCDGGSRRYLLRLKVEQRLDVVGISLLLADYSIQNEHLLQKYQIQKGRVKLAVCDSFVAEKTGNDSPVCVALHNMLSGITRPAPLDISPNRLA